MAAEDDNFFSRWSRRKVQLRTGQPLPSDPPADAPVAANTIAAVQGTTGAAVRHEQTHLPQTPRSSAASESVPALTLDDVAQLTRESDFKPFVASHVPAEVRNAALKKLFADPHFNVMDGLDIYIDDYSKPSPLSAAMLAKMVGARFLKLVDDPNGATAPPATAAPAEQVVAPEAIPDTTADTPSGAATALAQSEPHEEPHDDDADLQLQPDHAPESEHPGPGTG